MPTHHSPLTVRVRSGSCRSSSQPALSAENIGSSGSPVRARTVSVRARPARARWPGRRCAGPASRAPVPTGRPVCRSQSTTVSRCTLRATPTTRPAYALGDAVAHARLDARPDLLGVLLDPAGPGVVLRARRPRPARRRGRARPPASTSSSWCPGRSRGSGRQPRARPTTSPAASAMPSALRPKWSSRNDALPVGAKALSHARGCASARGCSWLTSEATAAPRPPLIVASSTVTMPPVSRRRRDHGRAVERLDEGHVQHPAPIALRSERVRGPERRARPSCRSR